MCELDSVCQCSNTGPSLKHAVLGNCFISLCSSFLIYKRGIGSSGAGVLGGCKPSDMCAANQTWFLLGEQQAL